MVNGFGDPAAVSAAAGELLRASTDVESAYSFAKRTQPDLWRGAAADAFSTATQKTLPVAQSLADTLNAAAGTLSRYAAVQRETQAGYASSQADFDSASTTLKENPFNISAGITLVQSRFAAFGALGKLQRAASTAADELNSGVKDSEEGHSWWDPFGWFDDPELPHERVDESITDDDSFDPDDVSQNQLGDCFLLVSVVSLLNTDEGDQFIRDNIRWDDDKGGYWVTLYPNGEAKEIFVEHVYGDGATQNDWQWLIFGGDKPSIAALYEAAISEQYGYNYLDGGVPSDAMALITGETVDVVENSDYSGLSPSQVDGLRDVLDEGGQVAISSPRGGEHEITVTGPDGNTREIEVVNTHAYAVMSIEPDGSVWMRNPWGPGNSADGGGEFLVSAEDVEDLFWRATSTNVTQ